MRLLPPMLHPPLPSDPHSTKATTNLSLRLVLLPFNMKFTSALIAASAAFLVSGQTLNIPTRVGTVQRARASVISTSRDFGNAEFDSGIPCDENEGGDPVFILENGVTISNLIIGPDQIDGRYLSIL